MAANVEHWVKESLRRREEVVVVIRNKATDEEVETGINPKFIAELVRGGEIKRASAGKER